VDLEKLHTLCINFRTDHNQEWIMTPKIVKLAGWSGVAAAVALIAETACFLASGWTAEKMNSPGNAIDLLAHGGGFLRVSALFGSSGIALTALLLAGLYLTLRAHSPRWSLCLLLWGLLGLAAHVLIPLGLWLTIPGFVSWGSVDPAAAGTAWLGFWNVCNAAQGVGISFGGAAMLATGLSVLAGREARGFAALGVIAGTIALFTVAAAGTPLQRLLSAVYLPMIALTILFRGWAGAFLLRSAKHMSNGTDLEPA
jgi:hypothetical protein